MFFIILIHFAQSLTISQFLTLTPFQIQQLSLDTLQQYFISGSLKGYLNAQEYDDLMSKLVNSFPQTVTSFNFGHTFQDIKLQTVKIVGSKTTKYQIVIVGMLHGTADMIAVNYLVYQLYYIVIALSKNDQFMTTLLGDKAIWITPAINVDTLQYLSSWFNTYQNLPTLYKNRNSSSKILCSTLELGVDLQRNFQYKFGQNDAGSSSDSCNPQYRGKHAFSEKETQMIDNLVSGIRPNIIIVLGGDSNYIVIPDGGTQTYNELLYPVSQKYYFRMGNYSSIYNSEINGDICSNYIYTINNICFSMNIGELTLNSTISNFNSLLTDFFSRYSSSLSLQLSQSFDCSKGKLLCKQLSSNEKGYLIIIQVSNIGYISFQDNIVLDIVLNQGGEKLYQIDQYEVSANINYSDPLQQSGIIIDEISTDQVYRYQIIQNKRLNKNQTIYFTFLLTQFGFSYNYINTVDSINLTFTLQNTLLESSAIVYLKPSDIKAKITNENLQSIFPNRAESYVLLICFGGISVIFFFSWIVRKIYMCIYDSKRFHDEAASKSGGSSDEKQLDQYYPHNLVESRLNTQVKFSQIAPFQSMRINDSPPLSKTVSGDDLSDQAKQQSLTRFGQREIDKRVKKALDIIKSQDSLQVTENSVDNQENVLKQEIHSATLEKASDQNLDAIEPQPQEIPQDSGEQEANPLENKLEQIYQDPEKLISSQKEITYEEQQSNIQNKVIQQSEENDEKQNDDDQLVKFDDDN